MPELNELLIPFGSSVLIGALIGIERERSKIRKGGKSPFGIRTSILISLVGAVAAYMGQNYDPMVFILTTITFFTLVLMAYGFLSYKMSRIGLTAEVSVILLYIYGAMCTTGYVQLAVIMGIFTTLVLTTKTYLRGFAAKMKTNELFDTIKFAIIAFIVLPFLPDKNYDDQILDPFLPAIPADLATIDVLNPNRIWLLIVFVSGISFVGYMLVKFFGKKVGISLTGLMGGLYSSTATSMTLAAKSKVLTKTTTPFLAGIILALAISYTKSFIFIRALSEDLFNRVLLPLGLMFLYLSAVGIYLFFKSKKEKISETKGFESPFKLKKAITLGGFIVAALLAAKITLSFAGVELYYVVATLSALLAIDDPIVISTAATTGTLIELEDAKNIILLVTFLNMVQKAGIVYAFGNRKLVPPLLYVFGGLLLVTTAGFIYF